MRQLLVAHVHVNKLTTGYLSMVLTIVLWAMGDRLSKGSSCNLEVRFIFFFAIDVPALGPGRVIALFFAGLLMVVYTGVTFTECKAWRRNGMSQLSMRDVDRETVAESTSQAARRRTTASGHLPRHHHPRNSTVKSRRYHSKHPTRQQWLGTDVDCACSKQFNPVLLALTS